MFRIGAGQAFFSLSHPVFGTGIHHHHQVAGNGLFRFLSCFVRIHFRQELVHGGQGIIHQQTHLFAGLFQRPSQAQGWNPGIPVGSHVADQHSLWRP